MLINKKTTEVLWLSEKEIKQAIADFVKKQVGLHVHLEMVCLGESWEQTEVHIHSVSESATVDAGYTPGSGW